VCTEKENWWVTDCVTLEEKKKEGEEEQYEFGL
jgi:hypothetical protein